MLHKKHSHIASFLNSVVNKAFQSQVNRRQIDVNQALMIPAESYFFPHYAMTSAIQIEEIRKTSNDDQEVI